MQSSDIPDYKFTDIWSIDAAGGNVTYPIPDTTATIGRASLQIGFPPETFQPTAAGGVPPFGQDFNGAYRMVTSWIQWNNNVGGGVFFDSVFSAAIGGYPKWAVLSSAISPGVFYVSTAENNTTDPDTGTGSWSGYSGPGLFNASPDSGTANVVVITINTAFPLLTNYYGFPLSLQKGGSANTGPTTLNLNNKGAKAILHPDGTPLLGGELPANGFFIVIYTGTAFHLQSYATQTTFAATSTQMEAAAATNVYAAPGTVGFHPGTVKAFAFYNAKTQTLGAHRNISSVTYNAVGSYTFNLSGGFNYVAGFPWINALDAVGGPCIGAAHGVLTGIDPSAQVGVFGNGTVDAPSGAFDPTSVLFFVTGEVSN